MSSITDWMIALAPPTVAAMAFCVFLCVQQELDRHSEKLFQLEMKFAAFREEMAADLEMEADEDQGGLFPVGP
ncbi:hypothetical protein CCHR01_01439 [Colletotrichum chrysophilum]|uniref:Uncharacterized protein n=1 Tax=Colletotrichum chrysophilum TaxID=1836956 RepID=A0AAD9B1Z5_9PEZI|nr:hypothetical protein CCHR01_01439 [Colletotrichum chrysophilum]